MHKFRVCVSAKMASGQGVKILYYISQKLLNNNNGNINNSNVNSNFNINFNINICLHNRYLQIHCSIVKFKRQVAATIM